MQTLPESNHSTYVIPGVSELTGVYQDAPMFDQGEDVILYFRLTVDKEPLTVEKYELEAVVKKHPSASNILWKGLLNVGLYTGTTAGYYYVLMPSSASGLFLPGLYYLDIKATEKKGTGKLVKDVTFTAASYMFSLKLSAGSPNPQLRPSVVIEVAYNPLEQVHTYTVSKVEPTLPTVVDITA